MDIAQLSARLEQANVDYRHGIPSMEDAEYDALEDRLRKADPAHPTLKKIGAPTDNGWPKVKHPFEMGSLNKAQDQAEFTKWVEKLPKGRGEGYSVMGLPWLFVTEKLDGISLRLTYVDGVLVEAVTRGDGVEGEEITRNVSIMQGVKQTIDAPGTVQIRNEVIITKTDFAAHYPGEKNTRNSAAGTAGRQTGWRKAQYCTVMAYQIQSDQETFETKQAEFQRLVQLGFQVPNSFLFQKTTGVTELRADYILKTRAALNYDIDGLVIEINDTDLRESMGSSSMKPKGATAFKFPHESKPTTLTSIHWQVGPSGRVTPVAYFEGVDLAGATIRQASLHNVANVKRLAGEFRNPKFFRVGDALLVSRRNDVIPYVEKMLDTNEDGIRISVPTQCPACNSKLEMSTNADGEQGEYLLCSGDACPAVTMGSMKRWISKVGVLHFGDGLLGCVLEAKLALTIGDLYRLKTEEVAALTDDGRRVGGRAKRALDSLGSRKALTLDYFIGSLGIHLVGRKMTLLLMKAGIDTLSKMDKASVAEMAAVPSFGNERAHSFREGFDSRKALIVDILAAGVSIVEPEVVEVTGTAMAGAAVCFTGVRDKEAEAAIVAQGGTIKSSVSKNCNILVCKDVNSTSSKAKKARGLGLEILDQAGMRARLGLS